MTAVDAAERRRKTKLWRDQNRTIQNEKKRKQYRAKRGMAELKKRDVPGSVQGVLPVKASKAISLGIPCSRRCGLKTAKPANGSLWKFYWAT